MRALGATQQKVFNFVLVSNKTAVLAMKEKSEKLGFEVNIISNELYDTVDVSIEKIFGAQKDNTVVLAAGEPKLEVSKKGGRGGRNLFMGLKAIASGKVSENSVFISFASDGMDNSDAAGAIVDSETILKIKKLNINIVDDLNNFDAYSAFEKTKDLILTGPTGANVSDLMMLFNKK